MSHLRISVFAVLAFAAMFLVGSQYVWSQGLTTGSLVTFDQPVEVPGHVLPAGTYSFVESGSSLVQVWDQNRKLVANLLTNAAEQSQFEPRQEFEFEKGSSDRPMELKAWFFDGGSLGHEFIYQQPSK